MYGRVIFIYETDLNMYELSTIFSPTTYWVDVTGKDCEVGYKVDYSDDGKTINFIEPTDEDLLSIQAEQEKNNLQKKAIDAVMSQLAGNSIESYKQEYKTSLLAIDDAVALKIPDAFPVWDGNSVSYTKDERVTYNGVLYKVLQNHTSQSTWTPETAPSLFAKVLVSSDGSPLPWEQPDSTNPYMKGDKVTYNGKTYESLIDNNVWSPDAYPAGWKLIS